jgi:predicted phosphodiesterase
VKIAVCSDLHLEFGDIRLKNTENADVLILAGDICTESVLCDNDDLMKGTQSDKYHKFFQSVCEKFKDVIYIMGNHEHYNGDFARTEKNLRLRLKYLKNLHFLEKETVKIGDVTFIGGTLWTDMNKEDPITLFHVKNGMNDFRLIKNSNRMVYHNVPIYERDENGKVKIDEQGFQVQISMKKKETPAKFSPEDSVVEHKRMLDYIRHVVAEKTTEKFVVVGHHCPSYQSISPKYKNESILNGAFSSNLDQFILDYPHIKMWIHGHTHEPFDYFVGSTRIVCNPRGYVGHEKRANEFELKFLEV